MVARRLAVLFALVPRHSVVRGLRSSATSLGAASLSSQEAGKKKVLVPIADGSEEIETTCIQDTLVRAGADVTVASANPESLAVTMSRGIKILADRKVEDVADEEWDLVVLPGGMPGAKNLKDSEALYKIVLSHMELQKPLAAVCATPAVVLEPWGILQGKSATCYPAPQFLEVLGDKVTEGDVVVDGNVLTSRGPGTSLKFALKCVETLYGVEKANELAKQMLVTDYN